MKILLVDDEVDFVSTLAERLSMRGYDATWCASASEAMARAETEAFDVAVLDVKMPGVGGIALRKSLQNIFPNMCFIFITGHGSEDDFNAGNEGAVSYLGKPINIDQLILTLNELTSKTTC